MTATSRKVSLFITCLVDQFFPEVGEAVVRVLRRQGVEVDFPEGQTCCGQPAFNGGFTEDAKAVARRFLDNFDGDQDVVVPSGSCGAMVKVFYPEIFHDEPGTAARAKDLSARTYEFSEYLVNVLGVTDVGASKKTKVAYHAACHLLRELRVKEPPRQLIEGVEGAEYTPMELEEACCGFGGTFSVKYSEISEAILEDKLKSLAECGADTLVSCDSSCLMHISGALSRRGSPVKAMHLAQLLDNREDS
ncbi:MAG: L-lactate dehydrogenase complex protein LldE [Chloroflexi bacterium]|jgi:L-lactate dehydrogenase complex protein LldE|nr:MAG: L-lactate dehydrogenase complex protein LldE [Chloroflexota bacterium]